jgi:hypothetical protein
MKYGIMEAFESFLHGFCAANHEPIYSTGQHEIKLTRFFGVSRRINNSNLRRIGADLPL